MPEILLERPLRLFSPAKVNLGLEVVRRRDDGYHDVVTVMQVVSVFDRITLTPSHQFEWQGDPCIDPETDLALRAITLFQNRTGIRLKARVRLKKRIPIAAGLAGGSSDAGTLLSALAELASIPAGDCLDMAASLGSDVPFFVHGGTALATGTGTAIEQLPDLARTWFVIVTPESAIRDKTATLYGRLTADDFSDGRDTHDVADALEHGRSVDWSTLRNSFARAVYSQPAVDAARQAMLEAGAPFVSPSGAGPSLFSVASSWQEADRIASRLRAKRFATVVCTNISSGINDGRLERARVRGV